MVNITSFLTASTTASENEQVNGIGINGTNPPSNFDDALRENWAILRRDLDGRMVLTSKSANYTAVAADNNAVIRMTAGGTLSLTAAATLGAGWHCWVMADGIAVIIDPNSSETINGAATVTIPDGYSTLVICDGTNFRAFEDYATLGAALATKADAVQATVDVASATTTDIGAAASWNVRITGTTTITGLGTVAEGTLRFVRMEGALTLTHNGTSLILPGAANITTAANDCFIARSLGSGNWIVMLYQRATGAAVGGSTLYVRDEKTSGTLSGGATAGTQVRVLNTSVYNNITGASGPSSNQVTLPAGTYDVEASAPVFAVNRAKIWLRTSGGTVLVVGDQAYAVAASNGGGICRLKGRFTLASSTAIEIAQYVEVTKASNGLGIEASSGQVEIYAQLWITKLD